MRDKTRRERYNEKKRNAKVFPISLVCVNFQCDGNLGYLIRAAACFGAEYVHIIGSVPARSAIDSLSGSLYDYVKIKKHNSPVDFLDYSRDNKIRLVSAEICKDSKPITGHRFNFDSHVALVVGNEQIGVPIEILQNSEVVYIPMPGIGYCLNTSQAANIMLYEATKQYQTFLKHFEKTEINWDEQGMYNLP
mgnify:FL=1